MTTIMNEMMREWAEKAHEAEAADNTFLQRWDDLDQDMKDERLRQTRLLVGNAISIIQARATREEALDAAGEADKTFKTVIAHLLGDFLNETLSIDPQEV